MMLNFSFLMMCTILHGFYFHSYHLPGKGKKGLSSCGESLLGSKGCGGTLLAKPFTAGFSEFSCWVGLVTLIVDFLKLFHRPERFKGKCTVEVQ